MNISNQKGGASLNVYRWCNTAWHRKSRMWLVINAGKNSSLFLPHLIFQIAWLSLQRRRASKSNDYTEKITMWLLQLHTISPEWLAQSGWWLCFTLIWGFSGQPEMGINQGSTKRRTSCQVRARLSGFCAGVRVSGWERFEWRESVVDTLKSKENRPRLSEATALYS